MAMAVIWQILLSTLMISHNHEIVIEDKKHINPFCEKGSRNKYLSEYGGTFDVLQCNNITYAT